MIEFAVAQELRVRDMIANLFSREEGQDMIEYALLAALIAISAIVIIILVGPQIRTLFQDVINGLRATG